MEYSATLVMFRSREQSVYQAIYYTLDDTEVFPFVPLLVALFLNKLYMQQAYLLIPVFCMNNTFFLPIFLPNPFAFLEDS